MSLKHGIRNGTGDALWGKDDVEKTKFGQDSGSTKSKAKAFGVLKGAKAALKKGAKKETAKRVLPGKKTKSSSKKAFAFAKKKLKK